MSQAPGCKGGTCRLRDRNGTLLEDVQAVVMEPANLNFCLVESFKLNSAIRDVSKTKHGQKPGPPPLATVLEEDRVRFRRTSTSLAARWPPKVSDRTPQAFVTCSWNLHVYDSGTPRLQHVGAPTFLGRTRVTDVTADGLGKSRAIKSLQLPIGASRLRRDDEGCNDPNR